MQRAIFKTALSLSKLHIGREYATHLCVITYTALYTHTDTTIFMHTFIDDADFKKNVAALKMTAAALKSFDICEEISCMQQILYHHTQMSVYNNKYPCTYVFIYIYIKYIYIIHIYVYEFVGVHKFFMCMNSAYVGVLMLVAALKRIRTRACACVYMCVCAAVNKDKLISKIKRWNKLCMSRFNVK